MRTVFIIAEGARAAAWAAGAQFVRRWMPYPPFTYSSSRNSVQELKDREGRRKDVVGVVDFEVRAAPVVVVSNGDGDAGGVDAVFALGGEVLHRPWVYEVDSDLRRVAVLLDAVFTRGDLPLVQRVPALRVLRPQAKRAEEADDDASPRVAVHMRFELAERAVLQRGPHLGVIGFPNQFGIYASGFTAGVLGLLSDSGAGLGNRFRGFTASAGRQNHDCYDRGEHYSEQSQHVSHPPL